MDELIHTFERLESENYDAIKSGRTHLQDATPIRFSQMCIRDRLCGVSGGEIPETL